MLGHNAAVVVTLQIHSGILNSAPSFNAAVPRHQLVHVSSKAPSGASTNGQRRRCLDRRRGSRDVLEGGVGGGEWRGGREGGLAGTPSSQGPPVVPSRRILKRKSSWHRRRRSKILAVSLQHWKGGKGGGSRGVQGGPTPPSYYGVRPF